MRRLAEQFPEELVIIGVHSAKFPSEGLTENIRLAARRAGIEHPVVNDVGLRIWDEYAVRAWPSVVLIDPAGKIARQEAGEIQAEDFIPLISAIILAFEERGQLDRRSLDLEQAAPTAARPLRFPSKLLAPGDGRLFVADTGNHRVIELLVDESSPAPPRAEIGRVFGAGQAGLRDGPAAEAAFNQPRGLALLDDRLYVADTGNHAIRLVDLTGGSVRTVAGTGQMGRGLISAGSPLKTPLRSPWAVLGMHNVGTEGEDLLFIAMAGSHQIWALLGERQVGVIAGNGREMLHDGSLHEASFNQPSDLAFVLGHLLVADAEASAVRAINLNEGKVFTLVGQGLFDFGDQDGTGEQVRLQHASGLAAALDQESLVYVADTYNHKIKTLDPITGEVQTLIGGPAVSGAFRQPAGLLGGYADGPFEVARFDEPEGLAVEGDRLWIADTNNHLLRIADISTRQVYTLELSGLHRLPANLPEAARAPRRLEPVTLAPGSSIVTFELRLPEGFKLNPDIPTILRRGKPPQTVLEFPSGQPVQLSLDLAESTEIHLELAAYPCRTGAEGLCFIHSARLVLPVLVKPGAAAGARVEYSISIDEENV